ncbi:MULTISPECIES: hypothetical protein [Pseudomonas]|uniref:hypothetical protein n=1 Tax=Pseudomonas TaxID=286 RepID=UPI000CF622E0|nr:MULTISPECIES: hypothetical protein [Pseudomonas]AVJ35951.1 hypothetical protein CLM75_00920 [Pseudomonas lurida]PRA13548.1 hypothetical protein CQ002_23485 [Pseudomonas sp. MYb13]PRA16884.1 hypothetical protein CQ004_25325 [Pseudomonas lurida]PRA29885.1 hypothetical protein CQ005_23560 [Pseudomonas lurida]PRB96129.1 hypothetical protein CQ014_23980 [Pseudomonas lurida]
MTPSLITRLCNIALKPGVSATTQLITTRRICRAITDQLDVIRSERRALRRQAGKLKAFLPFTRQTIAELEERAQEHQEAIRSGAWSALAGFGQSLMFDREGLAQALGFDQMCDLLGVNSVHRQQASDDGDTSLRGVAYLSQLEDSADRKSDEWGAGGPLYRACHTAMTRFLRECPEDQLPDPFALGAPFGPKLPPALSIVAN